MWHAHIWWLGVIIPQTTAEAIEACKTILVDRAFGAAGNEIVIEEYLDGVEASVLAFSDGVTVVPMPAAQDHKRVFEFNKVTNPTLPTHIMSCKTCLPTQANMLCCIPYDE